jgi:hypothetical protein
LKTSLTGCCYPERTIEIDVAADGADSWAWTAMTGVESDGSPVSPNQPYDDALIGPGSATLRAVQWWDEERQLLHSSCFEVVGVSASGIEGDPETVCVEHDLPTGAEDGDTGQGDVDHQLLDGMANGCGCSSTPAHPWTWMAIATIGSLRGRGRRPVSEPASMHFHIGPVWERFVTKWRG